jgi:hypothetical protein
MLKKFEKFEIQNPQLISGGNQMAIIQQQASD